MIKNNNKNLVMPVRPQVNGLQVTSEANIADSAKNININTYLTLTPQFKSLIISSQSKGGKYYLAPADEADGFYFKYTEGELSIKVPLTAIFNTTEKLNGILGVNFSTARECPSNKRGLCQLPDGELCYALKGERQGSKKSANYLIGMGSYYNGLIAEYYWNLFKKDNTVRERFLAYCIHYNINTIRYNLKGDFRSADDIKSIEYIAENSNIKLAGYTARDDLAPSLFDMINNNSNIILNGSNKLYSNLFMATSSLFLYLNANRQCIDNCSHCGNCYKAHGGITVVLLHGSGSDSQLKTEANIIFLTKLLKAEGLQITAADLKNIKLSGLLSSLNKFLEIKGYKQFKGKGSANHFKEYLRRTYNKQKNAGVI